MKPRAHIKARLGLGMEKGRGVGADSGVARGSVMPRMVPAFAVSRHTSRYVTCLFSDVALLRRMRTFGVPCFPRLLAMPFVLRWSIAAAVTAIPSIVAAQTRRPPLGEPEIDAISRLVMLEDRRSFDSTQLARFLGASHPEVRRRAALAIGRIFDKRGIALLRSRPLDADTAVAATVVFAVGHLRDSNTVVWFDSLLSNPRTPPTVATEAAAALGKIKTASARAALARYLSQARLTSKTQPTIAEALLSIGRAIPRGDLAPIVRFTKAPDEEIRWRAAWALFRPRDPASVPTLLAMSNDASGHVRCVEVRALARGQAESAWLGEQGDGRLG